jgi:hypothetical protein
MTWVNFAQSNTLFSKYPNYGKIGIMKYCKLITSEFRNTKNCDGMKNHRPRLKMSLPRLRLSKTASQRRKMFSGKTKTRKDTSQRQRCQSKTCCFTDVSGESFFRQSDNMLS